MNRCYVTVILGSVFALLFLGWNSEGLGCYRNNGIEVEYTHKEEHGVLALNGVNDAHAKPVLMSSCNDNVVRVYDLPSFNERGRIFSKEGVRALEIGPGGLFFTGDGAGELKVWKLFSN